MTLAVLATIIFALSLGVSLVLTAAIQKLAVRVGLVSRPAADRYHQTPTPLGGGIAIVTAFVLVAVAALVYFWTRPQDTLLELHARLPSQLHYESRHQLTMLACLIFLLFLGLWDDKKHLGPLTKLIFQFSAAFAAVILADVRVEIFIENKLITTALSAFWMVLIVNAFNFLDNMDGLAAGIAIIASSILFVAAAISDELITCGLILIFVGSLAGFLVFNFPPAKIFMGDAGSLPVGFLIAVITLRTTYYHQEVTGRWYPVFMPVLVMAVPIYDFISVSIIRLCQGKSPLVGDTQHFSHRLKRRGLSDRNTVLTLYLATLCTGLGATFLYQVNLTGAILIFAQTFMILTIIAIFETTGPNEKKIQ